MIYINKPASFSFWSLPGDLVVKDFPYAAISSVEGRVSHFGIMFAEVAIYCAGRRSGFVPVDAGSKKWVEDFCGYVRARIASIKEHASAPAVQKAGDLTDKLEKLVKLKEQRMLSDEEFQKAKKRLLEEGRSFA